MANYDGVRIADRHIRQRLEQARMKLDSRSRPWAGIGVETDEPTLVFSRFRQPADEVPFAASDFDYGRRVRQMHEQRITRLRKVPSPNAAMVEHPVGIAFVRDRFVTERAVPHVRTCRALDKIVREATHRLRLRCGLRPTQGRERLLPPVEELRGNRASTNRALRRNESVLHWASSVLKYAIVSFSPSCRVTLGSQFSVCLALAMSGWR